MPSARPHSSHPRAIHLVWPATLLWAGCSAVGAQDRAWGAHPLVLGAGAALVIGGVSAWFAGRAVRRWHRRALLLHQTMLRDTAHAVVCTAADGTVETMSRGAESLFRRSSAETAGRLPVTALVDEAELAERARLLAEDASGGMLRPVDVLVGAARLGEGHDIREWTCRRSDGSTFAGRVSVMPMHDGERSSSGFVLVVEDISAPRAVERQRREFDAGMAKLASQVPGMMFQMRQRVDGTRCLPYASDGIRDIMGLEPVDVRESTVPMHAAVHPDDLERVHESIRHSAETLERWQCEFRTRRGNGEVRWAWSNAMPERQPDGSVEWQGVVIDVTERKRAEQRHEESRTVLQSILSSVDLGVFLIDVLPGGDFRFVEVNPAYERLTGISALEIRGRTPGELVPVIPAEMAACLRASFRRALDATGSVEYEEPFFVRGRLLWWLTRLTPIRDESGRVARIVGRSLDITERKAVEVRVQSLTERLQLATEAAQLGIWDMDLVQSKLVWDARMLALYGYSATSFDGTIAAWRERLHPDDRARAEQEFREAAEGKKPFNTSFRIIRQDGEEREIRARAHVQRNPAGRPVRMVGVNWDVTAERRAQAEIEFARDQAEDLNRQLEDALERAHRLAQEAAAATVAKSEFLANMSHEIRTPLNAIIGMSGLLLGTELGRDQREFAETIRSSGDGLLALVNDILDYSKIESGRLELEHRAFDLRECVETSVDVLSARANEKKLDLLYTMSGGVPESVVGDVTRLRQVLVNLLSNAVKFTARGQVVVEVSVVPAQDSGRVRLRFAVHDSGIGIPADRMDRLFKTFSQVDASTTRQYGGTGLGLAISKRIIEVMGGRIWVESTAGKGSTFCFEIEAAPAEAPAKPFAVGRDPLLVGRKLLIVDDNPIAGRVLCQQVVLWGLVPRAVASAADALVLLRSDSCDAVLVDLQMSEAGGAEFIAEVRTRHPAAELPIGVLTAPGQPRLPDHLGIAGTAHKPVKTAALYELLGQMLHGRTAQVARVRDAVPARATEHALSILLAEDNPVNQRVAILMLQRLGYRADVAANGREAVAAALRTRYDLILMDVQMPEMDGLEASREICARVPAEQRPRIVAMTANASVADRDQCLAAGMADFLTKPVRAEDLRRALQDTPARKPDHVVAHAG